ncbi:MAG: hypothetical protein GX957_16065, partial [Clostridiaceae bacterium]|nr:hypothetical protein [Clostridiaceae bacterium]
ELIKDSDKKVIEDIINEVLERKDLFSSKREEFLRKLPEFRERYNV